MPIDKSAGAFALFSEKLGQRGSRDRFFPHGFGNFARKIRSSFFKRCYLQVNGEESLDVISVQPIFRLFY